MIAGYIPRVWHPRAANIRVKNIVPSAVCLAMDMFWTEERTGKLHSVVVKIIMVVVACNSTYIR